MTFRCNPPVSPGSGYIGPPAFSCLFPVPLEAKHIPPLSRLENRRPRNAFLGAQKGESQKGGDQTMRLKKEKPEFKFSNHLDKKSNHRTLLVSGAIQKQRRYEMHYPDMVTSVPIVESELLTAVAMKSSAF